MDLKNQITAYLFIAVVTVGSVFSVLNFVKKPAIPFASKPLQQEDQLSANSQYGLPGIFHATAPTIADGDGTALNTDSAGRVIISTTTNVSLNSI